MKRISLLGSTGSIGRQTLEVVREQKDMQIVALAANRQTDLLEQQIREFRPVLAVLYDADAAEDLKVRTADLPVRIESGMEGLIHMAQLEEAGILVTAIVGMIGIRPTLAALQAGKDIALANKETLVTAGHLIMPLAAEKKVRILPVDSEHSAIFQCIQAADHGEIGKLIITASGGPFRGKKTEDLTQVTAADALRHPNWSMGNKITIDSATMVNKGLEVCEAGWLFSLPPEKIEVVLQPQSIIHSMVEFCDGAVLAQLGTPDMRLPIQYALTWPSRRPMYGERLDFQKLTEIRFEQPDTDTFRGLPLAYEAIRAGGSMPTVLNAANEAAVALFLDGRIAFTDIYRLIEQAMGSHRVIENPTLEEILMVEEETRRKTESGY
ncbi:MAG: 1-deoxy-D-xylulose-5-phosphate reductoisomerase [Eubacterium sp.]|nr:1-deoxy-D-xylulose-5-phosphate reductoisomerase [Eubacterium sp.]